MRTNLSTKKIKSVVALVNMLIVLVALLSSCQKNTTDQIQNIQEDVSQKISGWVTSQKNNKTESGVAKTQSLINAMDLSKISVEQLNDKEKVFVVPLNRSFQTKFEKKRHQ